MRPLSMFGGALAEEPAVSPSSAQLPADTTGIGESGSDEESGSPRSKRMTMSGHIDQSLGTVEEGMETENDGGLTEQDLIRFSGVPLAPTKKGRNKENDLMRFSIPVMGAETNTASSSRNPLARLSGMILRSHRVSHKPPPQLDQPPAASGETVLPQRLQLNYNTDLCIGEPLPSNNHEKRIYAGTLAKDQGFMPRRIAVKHVWRNAAESDSEAEAAFVREVTIMTALAKSENVVRIVGYCTVPRVIVSDLYEGDLEFILGNRRFEFPESRALGILMDVAKALIATHKLGFAHGRIRPRAVLLERVKNTSRVSVRASLLNFSGAPAQPRSFWRARLGDFSASRPDGARENKARLSPRYASPECIQSEQQVTVAGDVYSFGVLIWQCLTRKTPWEGQEDGYVVWKICEGERLQISSIPVENSAVRSQLVDMTVRCCAEEHFVRPTMAQVLDELTRLKDSIPET
ncbi:kinase-like domain-containing protein [Fimicolochytrium jonesii]|uniref:kinase-like domain-containing protein n=1 Tax=Fimicolochytrium jonesii TaxID=1396493 RepID=UPI0022FE1E08|nr:kinase-like domain-containing protein [Fimicolochytrium jonesii]KAI8826939.1 kinase-like domain-containing protein [Fimicolochytrium jonesii]